MAFLDLFRKKQPDQRNYVDYRLGLDISEGSVIVTPETALTFSAVYAAVRCISESIAQLPLNYYKKSTKGREIDFSSNLQFLIHDEPNQYQTKYVFIETLINTLLLYGNAYAHIERDALGNPSQLMLIHPNEVQVKFKNNRLIYDVRNQGIYESSDIIHIPDMTSDGYVGTSRIDAARDNIALGIAAQNYGKNYIETGGKISGILKHPGQLGSDDFLGAIYAY